jgi:glucosamine-6-phosphate deaminase
MVIKVFEERNSLGKAAAAQAATAIRAAIAQRGAARVVAASAASQFEFLEALISAPGVDWNRVELFHLDEYIGLPMSHPASFCKFLQDRLIGKTGITRHHLLNGEEEPAGVIQRVGRAISAAPIDVAFVGIGENGHLAFNDPPADFETEEPYIVVTLDEACRQQQIAEGWFSSAGEVPDEAITITIPALLRVPRLIVSVPGARKAQIVRRTLQEQISTACPATILRTHPDVTIFLDKESAAELEKTPNLR